MSTTPAPASGLKYSDYTTMAAFATSSITLASVSGFLSSNIAGPLVGIAALLTTILVPITAYLRSKGD